MAMLRSLGTDLSGDKSPAPGTYPAEISFISDLEEKIGLKFKDTDPDFIAVQAKVSYRFFDYPYDADIDTKDWDGEEVSDYYVFQKKFPNDAGEVTKIADSYLDQRSKAYKLLAALMGKAPTREDDIDLEAFIGTKVDIGIDVKESGWPKVTSVSRRRAARRPATPAPKPTTTDDDSLAGTAFDTADEE